jgi:phage terminase large subunit
MGTELPYFRELSKTSCGFKIGDLVTIELKNNKEEDIIISEIKEIKHTSEVIIIGYKKDKKWIRFSAPTKAIK